METSITIFGVSLENNTRAQLLHQFEADLDGSVQKTIVTPNPEMLVLARGNKFFREALNKADIRLVDGFGLVLAVWQIFGAKLERYPGVEAVQDIITIAAEKGKKVFLLGGDEAVLEKLIATWSHKFPDLQIMGAVGPRIILDEKKESGFITDDTENKKTVQLIQDFAPDVLLVGFGHGKQELWLSAMLRRFSSVRLAMGVGGSFDYLSGLVPRAPGWMRKIGLEWLYRLACEPRRIKRIFNAVVLFPIFLVKDKIYE
ncbi:MAG: Glycosyl transferase, WecB/TagA/CpsF family [Candidatus Magasanikbacteria bacterium GW2011_GWA2_45_39]|uniref:Glycosyl transferase, WecB/TagA/CpsF family n=2 Tax=Candidatus Magasanikiibacteriota TaxID=1752731 RepID=A0A0G1QZR1_9BACT|nr:MAG: Glycosyl transferase, WecB/TagA/CpsF family [Candidatus Magasanikbacteria bacterium GW2011_GWA2_45_39]KKU14125.1 MAG: Glycosyl transferase, WecB/TagA/CpsF family [Candidatus Magasanikbacteria bacterium GW2011_GWC2_45_8]HBW73906.1 acetylglucosaminyldiphospho-UDP acetyl-beta-D-mannosaminyltransferase [Candidatus Magasanikbacteria bacterium]